MEPAAHLAPVQPSWLPPRLSAALLRGARGRCPRCDTRGLFPRFLKPAHRCRLCGQDWTLHSADDFPPYVSILLTGHLMAPVIILLAERETLPLWATLAIAMVLAGALLIAFLQPAKGAIIALQWWLGMHGFAASPGRAQAEAAFGTGE